MFDCKKERCAPTAYRLPNRKPAVGSAEDQLAHGRFRRRTRPVVDSETDVATKGASHVSVAKVIEITSTSPGSFEDAIRKGIAKAQQSIEGIRGAWVSEQKVELAEDGTIKHFRVDMKLTFILE